MVNSFESSISQFMVDYFTEEQLDTQASAGNISPDTLQDALATIPSEGSIPITVVADAVDVATNALTGSLLDHITTGSEFTGSIIDDMSQTVADSTGSIIDDMSQLIYILDRNTYGYIQDLAATVAEIDITQTNAALTEVMAALELGAQADRDAEASVFGLISDGWNFVSDQLNIVDDLILGGIDTTVSEVREVADAVVDQAQGFATALRDTIPEIGTAIVDGMGAVGGIVTEGFGAAFQTILETLGAEKLFDLFSLFGTIGIQLAKELGGIDDVELRQGSWDVPMTSVDQFSTALAGLPIVGPKIQLQHPAEFERMRLNSFGWTRPSSLDPATTLEYIRRFPGSEAELRINLERAGLSDEKIAQILQIRFSPLALAENVTALRREFISPETFRANLRALSLSEEDIDLADKLSFRLPPIGDLIRMVVRDVYDDDVVEAGELRKDIDTFPFETAEQLGLSREWSERYWMAHWSLPSLQQGFEMLHRNQIDDTGLTALFKAADVAPGYWEPLKQIAYRPFTRVDVRRMNLFLPDFGAAEVKRSYKDIGYDDEKAQTLTDFTIAYNDGARKGSKARERDLTKSDIIGMYNDGVLSPKETEDYLERLGYDENEVRVLIEREDIQALVKERKADIQNIIEQAKIKALTFEEAQDRLAALDLTRTETNKALADLARATEARTRTPSKADLDEWLNLTLLDTTEYADELRALGYADKYVDLYVQATTAETESDLLAQEVRDARRREPRAVSKGNLDSLFQALIVDETGYTEGLEKLGYRKADIDNLFEQQNIKLEERLLDEAERLARGEEAAVRERLPSRALLGKLILKGLIDVIAYREGLTLLGFSPENVELLTKLIGAKIEEEAGELVGVTG